MNGNQARSWQHLPQQTPNKKVKVKVRKQGWVTKGEKILYTLFSVGFIIGGIYIVSFSAAADSLNRDVQNLETVVQNQKAINENLQFEKKELSRPERITSIAKEHGLKVQDADVKQAQSVTN